MAPPYDNIADAPLLANTGAAQSIALDCRGATFEGSEELDSYGWAGVWVKIDLSECEPVALTIPISFVNGDSEVGFSPGGVVARVYDGTFDPDSPDWTKLWTDCGYLGDGTDTPSDTVTLYGGTGLTTERRSETGIYYIFFSDSNYAAYGSAVMTITLPLPMVCVDAQDVLNTSSATASVVGGRVRETYKAVYDQEFPAEGQPEPALRWTWSGATAYYRMTATARITSPGLTLVTGSGRVLVAVNGVPIATMSNGGTWASYGTDATWTAYGGLSNTSDRPQAPWVPLKNGDTVEVYIISFSVATGSTWVPIDLSQLCFVAADDAVNSDHCTPVFQWPADPLGDQWGSPSGWGGQRFVADEIWADQGIIPYDDAYFPWGPAWDFDMVALDTGVVYVISHDYDGSGVFPFTGKHYITVHKYDPGSDSWSQIATLNVRNPTDGYTAEAVSCEYDGTYVYFAWWEMDTYVAGPPKKWTWKWHMVRLNPGDDGTTELGTGQSSIGVTTAQTNYPGGVLASAIACSGNGGDIYVAANETTDDANAYLRMIVWRWDGASWSNTSLPDPGNVSGSWRLRGRTLSWNCLAGLVTANKDGPTTTGVTVAYTYQTPSSGLPADFWMTTRRYDVGSGWSSEIITEIAAIEGDARMPDDPPTANTFEGMSIDLLWSDNRSKLLLALNIAGPGPLAINPWDVWQLDDAGTQWEVMESIKPAWITGSWRNARSRAVIGPDGEVYRSVFASSTERTGISVPPMLSKSADGYLAGWSIAESPPISVSSGPPTYQVQMAATTNYRLRIVGETAYVICSLDTFEFDTDTQTFTGNEGNGIFVFKLDYLSCEDLFVPHIYRIVYQ